MRAALVAFLALIVVWTAAVAEEVIPNVEYQGGHSGMKSKVKGSLRIDDIEIQFLDAKGKTLLAIPIKSITDVSSSMDRKDASVGAKLALGFLAKSRKDELVTISMESSETAEGIVFKTEKNASAGVVAKIRFQMKKLSGGQPTTSVVDTNRVGTSIDSTKH
jgi:hypothetical protein